MKDDIIQTINLYKGNTKKIAIYAISDKGRLKIQELDFERGGVIRCKRLKELNRKNEGIYFAPEDDYCNMLFLDDPTCLKGLPRDTMVIETSLNKYQAHIPFTGPPQDKQSRTEFQRQLCHIHKADKGAVYANHLRRLPGFHNQKYADKPLIRIFYITDNSESLTLEKLLVMVEKREEERYTTLSNGGILPKLRHAPRPSDVIRKSWREFYDDGDKSRADMRYVLYLLRMGVSEEDVRDKLLRESEGIEERKKGYLADYLSRTIRKANEYFIN
jgi:hypothetical protein